MEHACERQAVIAALCSCLEQENERTRWCAVQTLARLEAREAFSALVAGLSRDPDPDVRMEIAQALGTFADSAAVQPLVNALHDDPEGDVRLEACKALGNICDPRAVDALITCLQTEDAFGLDDWETEDDIGFDVGWVLQREALERLGTLGDPRAVDAVIQLLASDEYDDLQETGLRVLAMLGGEHALAYVLQHLRRGSDTARRRAARALAHTEDSAVIDPLMTALADRDVDVRLAAGWSLAHRQHPAILPQLTTLLNDPSEMVRREAITMMAPCADEEVSDQLVRLLSDAKPAVRQQAIQVLGDRGEQRAVAPMLALLARSRHDEVTANALIKALGQIASPEVLEPLCHLLQDDHTPSTVRLQAALALADLLPAIHVHTPSEERQETASAEPDLVALLTALVEDDDPHVCRIALLALGKLGDDAASAVFLKALHGELPEVPQETPQTDTKADEPDDADFPTSTLAAIQAAQAVHTAPALAERRRVIRRQAASVLRETTLTGMHEALLTAAESDDAALRTDALLSLEHIDDAVSLDVVRRGCTAPARDVRLAAIDALRRCPAADVGELLIDLLHVENDPLVVSSILDVLGRRGDTRATALIVAKLHDDDTHVQRSALESLAHLGDRTAIAAIRPLLFADGGAWRHDAVRVLRRLGDTDVVPHLLATLSQQDEEEYHWMAIEALATLYGRS